MDGVNKQQRNFISLRTILNLNMMPWNLTSVVFAYILQSK